VQVILATSRPSFCDSLCLFLSTFEVDVVGTTDRLEPLFELAANRRPDVVLIGAELADSSLGTIVDRLRQLDEPVSVVVFQDGEEDHPHLGDAHPDAYVTMGDSPHRLIEIMKNAAGQRFA
jgi:DNA-binding NarL/FixJ family response regulator